MGPLLVCSSRSTHLPSHFSPAPLLVAMPEARAPCASSPLMLASENGFDITCSRLLAANANANAMRQNGWTPLMMTAYNGHASVARVLLNFKADVSYARSTGMTVTARRNRIRSFART